MLSEGPSDRSGRNDLMKFADGINRKLGGPVGPITPKYNELQLRIPPGSTKTRYQVAAGDSDGEGYCQENGWCGARPYSLFQEPQAQRNLDSSTTYRVAFSNWRNKKDGPIRANLTVWFAPPREAEVVERVAAGVYRVRVAGPAESYPKLRTTGTQGAVVLARKRSNGFRVGAKTRVVVSWSGDSNTAEIVGLANGKPRSPAQYLVRFGAE